MDDPQDRLINSSLRFASYSFAMRAQTLNPHRIPKLRQYAEISMSDGSVFTAYVFVEATARIQDLLNNDLAFMPFSDGQETVHLINKNAIVRVLPYD